MSSALLELEFDTAILELLFADHKSLLAREGLGFLYRIGLEKAVQLFLLAPAALVVVVVHGAAERVDHGGILPAGQVHE